MLDARVMFSVTDASLAPMTAASALTPTLAGKLPSSVIAGQKAAISETVTLANTSGSAYSGASTTKLYLSTGTAVDSNSIALPVQVSKSLNLKTGAHTAVKFSLKSLPSTVANGTYHVVAQVTDKSGNTAVSASATTITIAPPEVDLAVTVARSTATAKGGRKFSEAILVANDGNIPAKGVLPILIETSPDGSDDATPLTTINKSINAVPGKKALTINLSLVAPATGTSAFLIFTADPDNKFNDPNLANNTAVTATAITFT